MRILTIVLLSLGCLCAYAASNKYALLVQVTQYKEQATKQNPNGIPSYVGKDPREVNNLDALLIESAIRRFGFDAIEKLVDAQATREAILAKMNEIARKAQPGDVVLFYFTGHGAAAQGGFTIAPYDAKPESADNDIHSDELYQWASRLRAQHIVIVLDSCFHHDPKRYPDGSGDRPPLSKPKMIEGRFSGTPSWGKIESLSNTVILTASDMGQKAYQMYYPKRAESEQWVGVFTWHLSKTLKSKDSNPQITYAELIRTLRKELKNFVQDTRMGARASQSPQLLGDPALHSRPIFEPRPSSPPPPPPPSVVKIFFEANVPERLHEAVYRMYRECSQTPERIYDPKTADVIVRMKNDVLEIVSPTENPEIPSPPKPPTSSPIVNHPILKQLVENANRTKQWMSVSLDKPSYSVGDAMRVTVRLERPGYLVLVSEDKSGKPSLLYPPSGNAREVPAGTHTFPESGFKFIVDESPTNTLIAVLMQDESDCEVLLNLLRSAPPQATSSRGIGFVIEIRQLLETWLEKCSVRYCTFSIQR